MIHDTVNNFIYLMIIAHCKHLLPLRDMILHPKVRQLLEKTVLRMSLGETCGQGLKEMRVLGISSVSTREMFR